MNNFSITATYTDLYQLTMGQVYFQTGNHRKEAAFDYFFRKLPFAGGYVVFAGVEDVLKILETFQFSEQDISFLNDAGLDPQYVEMLSKFRFGGNVYSAREGEIVFPNEPLLRIEGNMLETQLAETLLLNIINFESLIATKASRMRLAAGNKTLSDFGLRRAQGVGGYHATRAAIIGGFNNTSNVKAAMDFDIPVAGTMAHSFIQSYDNELSAFRDFAEKRSAHCILLVDTYDTLRSGVPNAITVAKEMEQRSQRLYGIRLDSGDLAYLSKQARKMLNDADLHYVKITASNQLDEYVIKSLEDQQAPIDGFGVGTSLVTGPPDAALDGVYKLAFADGTPRIKLSENLKKLTLPHKKQIFRMFDPESNYFEADVITLYDEKNIPVMHHPYEPEKSLVLKGMKQEPLLHKVMEQGRRLHNEQSLKDISTYSAERLSLLPAEHKRFDNPHIYRVGLSEPLKDLRDELRNKFRK
jgi:nicotinate phosphoribosyltransferase